jgi:hypothetical protein
VTPDKRESLFRQVASSAHDVICDFVFRQAPSCKSKMHPSLLQPFHQLTSAQQGLLILWFSFSPALLNLIARV